MNGILVNLMLAVFWLVLAGGCFLYEPIMGKNLPTIGAFNWNPGWLALIIAAYNFYRIMMIRSRERRRQEDNEERETDPLRRHWERRREMHRREEPPNPDFQFKDEPAPPPPAPREPTPPSN